MSEQDPDILEMKRQNRKALREKLTYVGLAVLALGIWTIRGWGIVRGDLEQEGHTAVEVSMKSPFGFTFASRKGTMQCTGTVTRYPFSRSKTENCVGPKGGSPVETP